MRIRFLILTVILIYSCSSDRSERLRFKSEEFYSENDCESALDLINKAIRINEENPIAYNDRATYYLCLNKLDLAFKDINKALEIDENYNQAYVNRGSLYFQTKEFTKAINDLQFAYNNDYELQNTIYRLILSLNSAGRLNEALQYCNEHIESFSDSLIYMKRALINYELNNISQANSDASTYMQFAPSDEYIYILHGKLKNKENKHFEAIAYFKKCIELNPKNSDAYYNLGYTYFEMDSLDIAFYNSKQALNIDTTNLILYQLGRIDEFRGNYIEAIEYFTKAIQIDTLDAKSYFARGMNYGIIDEHQLLYNDLQKAFSLGYTDEKYSKGWWEVKKVYLNEEYNVTLK